MQGKLEKYLMLETLGFALLNRFFSPKSCLYCNNPLHKILIVQIQRECAFFINLAIFEPI